MKKHLANIHLALFIAIVLFAITGCDTTSSDEWCDKGYGDGYAAGYNTTCEIRMTIIEGAWDEPDYKRCYNYGYSAGSDRCYSERGR